MTRPRTIADIPTPALLVGVRAMERNIRRMAEFFAVWPVPVAAALQGPQDAGGRPPPARRRQHQPHLHRQDSQL